jgi:SAM-dependent methyltransferase
MDFADSSVDALVSICVLEHIYDFDRFFSESYRCLKPGGRLLLIVPFLYFFHGAPDDFFRFTESALDRLLNNFKILLKKALGSRELLVAELYHEKTVMGSRRSVLGRVFLRLLAMPFLYWAIATKRHDSTYAIAHVYLCERPANHRLHPRYSNG